MKIYEIDFTEIAAEYIDEYRDIWHVNTDNGIANQVTGRDITEELPLKIILAMDFKKYVDWSKVPVDTKILVKDNHENEQVRRHFARFEDGKIRAWNDGLTSFTAKDDRYCTFWECAKLYEEK